MELVHATPSWTPATTTGKRKRARQACDHCRARKIRCNGQGQDQACPNCLDRGVECITSPTRAHHHARGEAERPETSASDTALENLPSRGAALASPNPTSVNTDFGGIDLIDENPPTESRPQVGDLGERSSILPNDLSNWEYHGPRTYLSICSKPAVKWVQDRTRDDGFAKVASSFTADITRRLKMDIDLSTTKISDPDPQTARKYTKAYFDLALDASMGILDRRWFEQQLTAHLAGVLCDPGPIWHALRNVVFAAGCRIEESKTKSFQEASQGAWRYFENALSVYARLLFYKTSITGVQVLTLMAYYTQNIGTPCLEYMLSADAVRLAFAKGLHRAAPSSQGLSASDTEQRSCIFWALYCLEKQIACQAGRPSIIDDDEVTCPLPSATPIGSSLNLAYCRSLICIAKASSKIEKTLSAVKLSRMGCALAVQTVHTMDKELTTVKHVLDETYSIRVGERIISAQPPNGLNMEQHLYIQFAYHATSLSVHTVLAYPWVRTLIGLRPQDPYQDAVSHSTAMVAKASRNAIMSTEHIDFRAQTPVPVAFFGPMYALISLFVCCLDTQTNSTDLAVMDVGAGYFGRIHLATESLVSVPFVRSMSALMNRHNMEPSTHSTNNLSTAWQNVGTGQSSVAAAEEDISGLGILEGVFDLEDWSTFSQTSLLEPSLDFMPGL